MRLTARFLIATLVLLNLGSAFGQDGLALMKVDPSARGFGMAGAMVSIAGDPGATAYNPAAAIGTEQFALSLGHNTHWENIRIESGYFATNLSDRYSLHGGIRYAAVDDIESRRVPSLEPDALFSAYDMSFKTGLSFRLTDKLAGGVALGWFIEKIDIYRGSAFNADFGLLYQANEKMSLGASITNLGSALSIGVSGEPAFDEIDLPTTYRLGGSAVHRWGIGAVEAVIIDDDFHLHAGVESALYQFFRLRAGYMTGYDTKNFTAGASFERRKITVDYAFVPYSDDLGSSHLFNLTFTL